MQKTVRNKTVNLSQVESFSPFFAFVKKRGMYSWQRGIFSGCTLVQVDAEADGNRVVAVVNGEEILKKDWYSVYYMYYMYYGSSADEETLEELKNIALHPLIYQTLGAQQRGGLLLITDEQRAQAGRSREGDGRRDPG